MAGYGIPAAFRADGKPSRDAANRSRARFGTLELRRLEAFGGSLKAFV
jgi:hypothetical protein